MAITPLVNERIGAIEGAEQKIKDGIYCLAQLFDPVELELIGKNIISADHAARQDYEKRAIIRNARPHPSDVMRIVCKECKQFPRHTKECKYYQGEQSCLCRPPDHIVECDVHVLAHD